MGQQYQVRVEKVVDTRGWNGPVQGFVGVVVDATVDGRELWRGPMQYSPALARADAQDVIADLESRR